MNAAAAGSTLGRTARGRLGIGWRRKRTELQCLGCEVFAHAPAAQISTILSTGKYVAARVRSGRRESAASGGPTCSESSPD